MKARRRPHHVTRFTRGPQGIEAELAAKPDARPWLHEQLRAVRPLATIRAELWQRFGIAANPQALSRYRYRHAAAITPAPQSPQPLAGPIPAAAPAAPAIALPLPAVDGGQWLLTIHAPGATSVAATLAPLASR